MNDGIQEYEIDIILFPKHVKLNKRFLIDLKNYFILSVLLVQAN